ncbi:MAG: hypothetical protein WDZ46_04075 [Solirubrobacterales bacterium]
MRLRAVRAWLDRCLFPDPPAAQRRGSRVEGAVLVAALLVLAIVAQMLRPGMTASLNSIWAEDGLIFLQPTLVQSFGSTIFTPYAEYLVLVPRLIAELAAPAPLGLVPATMSVLSAAVVALGGLAVWHASAAHIASPVLRGALAALAVLVPVAGLEAVDSASYVSWYMLFAGFWLLLWRPPTMRGAALGGLFLLATALSNPGVWLFLPLAALRAMAIRDRRDATILGGYAIGAAIQIPVVAAHDDQAANPTWTSDIWTAYLQRVVDGGLLGEKLGGVAWENFGWEFLTALLVVTVLALLAGLWRADVRARCVAAIAIPASLAMFAITAYQREVGSALIWPPGDFSGVSSRYTIVPALLLISTAFVLLDSALRDRGRARSAAIWATAALALIAIATSFSVREIEVRGTPPWDDALRGAAAECRQKNLIEAPVPTSPRPFGVFVPCNRLEGFAGPPAS